MTEQAQPTRYADAIGHLLREARGDVMIFSAALCPAEWNNRFVQDALSEFLRRSAKTQCRIVVRDVDTVVETGHVMLRLARRLPSSMGIRLAAQPYIHEAEEYAINDSGMLLYKHRADDADFRVLGSDTSLLQAKRLSFQDNWNQAHEHVKLRELHL